MTKCINKGIEILRDMSKWRIIISTWPADQQWTTKEVPLVIVLTETSRTPARSNITKTTRKIGQICTRRGIGRSIKTQSK